MDSFPRFNDLVVEIRLQIWELSFPGPRIIRMSPQLLKGGICERVWSDKANDTLGNEAFFIDQSIAAQKKMPAPSLDIEYGPDQCYGMRAYTSTAPGSFFACHEAYDLASTRYVRAFASLSGVADIVSSVFLNLRVILLYSDRNIKDT